VQRAGSIHRPIPDHANTRSMAAPGFASRIGGTCVRANRHRAVLNPRVNNLPLASAAPGFCRVLFQLSGLGAARNWALSSAIRQRALFAGLNVPLTSRGAVIAESRDRGVRTATTRMRHARAQNATPITDAGTMRERWEFYSCFSPFVDSARFLRARVSPRETGRLRLVRIPRSI